MAKPAHLAEASLELHKLARQRPTLEKSCAVLAAIVGALFERPVSEAPPLLAADVARAKLARGVPFLRDVPIPFDKPALERRWRAVCAALKQADGDALADAVRQHSLDPAALLNEVLAGRVEAVALQAEPLGLEPALTATVLRLTWLPVLANFASAWTPLRVGVAWDYG